MRAPRYLHVVWKTKPTNRDPVGCDGLYVESVKVDWWGWPFLLVWAIKRRFKE
jgi:hypothetical protein